ncbi:hypothetical protein EMIHUDRAFT_449231 [Emiliania huxleyi CCMP1516]|uniref:Protein SirB1 N-terminal domain-containing protein n=2 Tax=Emiliania huxleyi TaxID=2903 RepID=A0A0D3KI73_EMIH1|nr:hypothetical protein EMIHUDRAFT_449231 [Emiliania huxleyi CCMP1516]EOD35458.1 hypothetical protein EMIHUDRAFT_449231 [Emiliania huxleyi CCMP1516]|eukprot:XP_005787887.1 hypothetical protein EMIHUDRAFT_449231 [Emiliania huxleyi CCMP1516]
MDGYSLKSFRANLVREQRGIAGAQALHTDEAPSGGGDWWVHELAAPEPGCLLLAQPHAHIVVEEPLMHRAVVLVLEHDAARGTVGLLLDTPANATVSQMLRRRAEPSPHLLPLGGNQLLVGGTVLPRERLRVLTSRCDVPGARRVLPGLYSCAPDAAARMVAIGAADAASFDVYAAACQWSPLQLREELEAALWLPAAASAAAIARPREWRRDGVYFNLVEGLGGQYLKQARRRGCLWARAGGGVPALLARTEEEVRSWLATRSALAPGLLRALAADVLSAEEAGAGGRREAGGGREARGVEPPRPAVTADEVSFRLHALLYPRDNLTDVPRSPKSALRRRSSERAGAAWAASGGSSPPGGKTSLSGSPALRVLSAAAAGRVSQENALHAIQLLLFDVLDFHAAPEPTPEQASLPDLLRRRGGAASLFSLCVLYATLARKLGVGLQLVRLSPPPGRTLRGPPFLLALGPAELFIDILAAGRLRTLSDLAQFLDGGDGDGGAVGRLSPAQLRAAAKPLDQRAVCLQLVRESEASSASVGRLAHAQFWSAQRELLEAYLRE